MAVGRLPSGRFRPRLMIDGQRYTATAPTPAEARRWEVETRGPVAKRRGAGSMTFAAYAEGWSEGFIDSAPVRTRFERALRHRLVPVLREWPLYEALEADRNELDRLRPHTSGDVDGGALRECLHLILEDAAEDLRIGVFDVSVPAQMAWSGC